MLYGTLFDRMLLEASEQRIRETVDLPAGQVIAAVARATIHARELYGSNGADLPSPEHVVQLVMGMAKEAIAERQRASSPT